MRVFLPFHNGFSTFFLTSIFLRSVSDFETIFVNKLKTERLMEISNRKKMRWSIKETRRRFVVILCSLAYRSQRIFQFNFFARVLSFLSVFFEIKCSFKINFLVKSEIAIMSRR